jgi:hypothetical protein
MNLGSSAMSRGSFYGRAAQALICAILLTAASSAIFSIPAFGSTPIAPQVPVWMKNVSFLGYNALVPVSWQVVDLNVAPMACVRFDLHAVYLGVPGPTEHCPAHLIATKTEALLVEPLNGRDGSAGMVADPVAHEYAIADARAGVKVIATYGSDQALIKNILDRASVTRGNATAYPAASQSLTRSAKSRTRFAAEPPVSPSAGRSVSPSAPTQPAPSPPARLLPAPYQASPTLPARPLATQPLPTGSLDTRPLPARSLRAPGPTAPSHPAPVPLAELPRVAPPRVAPPHIAPPHIAPPHAAPPHIAPPHAAPPLAARAHAALPPTLPASVTNYTGLGFDACTAPDADTMQAWISNSPYRAVGIYIGGSDRACAQPNLTADWVSQQAAAGWHFIPLYVGPQAEWGQIRAAISQGVSAADDAVTRAQELGFGPGTPLYYDMEAYPRSQSGAALQFLSAWTEELHTDGFASGVYSSSASAVADLADYYPGNPAGSGDSGYAMPDVIFDALWNGDADTTDALIPPGDWTYHRRIHQYSGGTRRVFGGHRLNIDRDYLDVLLPTERARTSGTPHPNGRTAQLDTRAHDSSGARVPICDRPRHPLPPVACGHVKLKLPIS